MPFELFVTDRNGAVVKRAFDRRPGSSVELRANGFGQALINLPWSSNAIPSLEVQKKRMIVNLVNPASSSSGGYPILTGPIMGINDQDPAGGGEATATCVVQVRDPSVQFDYVAYTISPISFNQGLYLGGFSGSAVDTPWQAIYHAINNTNGVSSGYDTGHKVQAPVPAAAPGSDPNNKYWTWRGGQTVGSVLAYVLGLDNVIGVSQLFNGPGVASPSTFRVHRVWNAGDIGSFPGWRDLRNTVKFDYGFGQHTASGFFDSPAGEEVINKATVVGPTGDTGLSAFYARAEHLTSQADIGIWERWESSNNDQGQDTDNNRFQRARNLVKSAAYAPAHFDFIPSPPRGTQSWGKVDPVTGAFSTISGNQLKGLGAGPVCAPASIGGDFWLGDIITLRAHRENVDRTYVGMVAGITLTENEQGVIVPNIECEPVADYSAGISTSGGGTSNVVIIGDPTS